MTLPHDHVLLFDGVCNFCASFVQFIIRHDKAGIFRFLSIQSDLGREIYRAAGLDPDDPQTFALISKGQTLIRSDAAIEIAWLLGGIWRLFVVFKALPRGLRDWVYSQVARRRYKWFGKQDSCLIPSEDIRSRFLG